MPVAHAQRLRLRLFIEGIEVPVISANVQSAPNSPGVATIQIPPLSEATRFLPRSVIHLFFLDMYVVQSPFLTTEGVDDPNEGNPSIQEANQAAIAEEYDGLSYEEFQKTDGFQTFTADKNNSRYKLLFGGEMVGFTWSKNENQRSIVLQCEDWSNYWDYAYQWNNTGLFGPGIKAIFSGGATNLHTDFLSSKSEDLARLLLHGKSNTFPNLTGLAAGIIKLIEGIGGTYFPPPGSGAKRIAGQNIFFSIAELRLKITHMVAAVQDDKTSQALLARSAYSSMFSRALGGLGGQTSIRQAVNALTKIIFHEMYPQPCPLFVNGSAGDVQGLKTSKMKDHPKYGFVVDVAEQAIAGVQAVKKSLEKLVQQLEIPEFARVDADTTVREAVTKLASVTNLLHSHMSFLSGKNVPTPAAKIFTTAATFAAKAHTRTARFRPDAPPNISNVIFKSLDRIVTELEPALDLTVKERATNDSHPARIVQQVFRPDIWFSAPPRCNVLFPESYHQLQYRRHFLQEPTRFLLKTNDEFFGEDFLFDRLYFAPQAGGTARGEHTRLKEVLQNNLLDHELFTGILPIHEKMGEFNIFASRTHGATAGAVPKVGPAQRSANFLYFKHRFNSRRMMVRGKFNPYIAMGCPGLILDKHVDAETIARYNELKEKLRVTGVSSDTAEKQIAIDEFGLEPQALSEILGTNFLGNFTTLTHAVSAIDGTGRTEVMCSYPRQTEESVEFLGSLPENQKVKKKSEDAATRSTKVAALNPPRVFSLGPNFGRITNVQDITSQYANVDQSLPLFDPQSPETSRTNPIKVPIGPTTAEEAVDAVVRGKVEELSGGEDVEITFRAFLITEEIARYKREDVLIPAEEFIRPGWYGDIWSSAKIGKVYNELFGIGAITDEQTITGRGGEALGSPSEDSLEAADTAVEASDADDPRLHAPALLALEKDASIQNAVEFLLLTYSYIRQSGLDTEEFIRAYTWRPIATMVDMFGTSDLEFNQDGSKVVSGLEGFHSRAFGPFENLHGLADPEIESIIGIGVNDINNRKVDTRLRKYKAVQKYVSAIRFSRAILG
jgi:hypothetical protein